MRNTQVQVEEIQKYSRLVRWKMDGRLVILKVRWKG